MTNYNISDQAALAVKLEALQILAAPVKSTMGPGGKTVILRDTALASPIITKDGATVANHVFDGRPEIDLMIRLYRDAALSVEREVGDGTTTATVLTEALILAMDKHDVGVGPWMDALLKDFTTYVNATKVEITKDDVYNVALSSVNMDKELATLVAEVVKNIGAYGRYVTRATGDEDYATYTNGYSISRGIIAEELLRTNEEQSTYTDKVGVVLIDGPITTEVLDNYEECTAYDTIIVIGTSVTDDELDWIVDTHRGNVLRTLPVTLSSFQRDARAMFADLTAVLTTGYDPLSVVPVVSVTITNGRTTFVPLDNFGALAQAEFLIKQGRTSVTSQYDQERLNERVSRLQSGSAVVLLSGPTEAMITEKVHRIDDAILACQSAIKHGVVPGAGNVYMTYYSYHLNNVGTPHKHEVFHTMLNTVLHTVTKQIHTNLGQDFSISTPPAQAMLNSPVLNKWVTPDEFTVCDAALIPIKALTVAISMAKLTLGSDHIIMGDPRAFTSML